MSDSFDKAIDMLERRETEIARLRAENENLRAALEKIVNSNLRTPIALWSIARAALEGK